MNDTHQNNTVEMDGVCDILNNMSTNNEGSSITSVCANCGKESSDVTNTCNKCKLVMYCNASCKKRHRHKHKKDCEEHLKRAAENAAELHDEKLFKQPPPLEDCPICFIRLPLIGAGQTYMNCCGKVICSGCEHAYRSRATKEEHDVCPYCRTPPPNSDEEYAKRLEKRMELNDNIAMYSMAGFYSRGERGLPQNHAKALKLWRRAAELGSAEAYLNIGTAYKFGRGVEVDEKKAIHHCELAAMGGCVEARHNLGCIEKQAGKMDRALKHWMIATKDGYKNALESIKRLYSKGHATKDDYTEALRSYQAYLYDVKSDQRDEAAVARSGSNSN